MTFKAAKYVLVLLLAPFFASPCFAQDSIFVQFDTFKCRGAGDPDFPDFSAAFSVEFAGAGAVAPGTGGGSGGGKTAFADIKVTKTLDDCTPLLFKSLATLSHLATVKISMVTTASPPTRLLDILLEGVVITSDQYSESATAPPSEVVTLAWTKITVMHVPSGNKFTWDRATNSSF